MKLAEEWIDIPEYEGCYQINRNGDIKSLHRFHPTSGITGRWYKERILKPYTDKDGYLQVILHKEGKPKTWKVHRLVAITFLGNPNNFPSINHKDEDKQNNCVENLEWCTIKYNNDYNQRQSKIGEKRMKPVAQYDEFGNLLKVFESVRDAAISMGGKGLRGAIIKCCKKQKPHYKHYIWKYYEIS